MRETLAFSSNAKKKIEPRSTSCIFPSIRSKWHAMEKREKIDSYTKLRSVDVRPQSDWVLPVIVAGLFQYLRRGREISLGCRLLSNMRSLRSI